MAKKGLIGYVVTAKPSSRYGRDSITVPASKSHALYVKDKMVHENKGALGQYQMKNPRIKKVRLEPGIKLKKGHYFKKKFKKPTRRKK